MHHLLLVLYGKHSPARRKKSVGALQRCLTLLTALVHRALDLLIWWPSLSSWVRKGWCQDLVSIMRTRSRWLGCELCMGGLVSTPPSRDPELSLGMFASTGPTPPRCPSTLSPTVTPRSVSRFAKCPLGANRTPLRSTALDPIPSSAGHAAGSFLVRSAQSNCDQLTACLLPGRETSYS